MLTVGQVLALTRISRINKKNLTYAITNFRAGTPSFDELLVFAQTIKANCTAGELTPLLKAAEEQVAFATVNEIQVISVLDPLYPKKLNGIPNQPLVLFVKGNALILNTQLSVAVVGTREATALSLDFTKKFAVSIAKSGICVVSGLAIGCDTAAHEGAIDSTGCTIAVMAHGLDMIYPKENIALAEKIIAAGGCIVSEHTLGVKPQKRFFVQRNRIQSGLSAATFVVQSAKSGGTMTTANHCLSQGRTLVCMDVAKEFIDSKDYEGNMLLIKNGAQTVSDPVNIKPFIDMLEPMASENVSTADASLINSDSDKARPFQWTALRPKAFTAPRRILQPLTPGLNAISATLGTSEDGNSAEEPKSKSLNTLEKTPVNGQHVFFSLNKGKRPRQKEESDVNHASAKIPKWLVM